MANPATTNVTASATLQISDLQQLQGALPFFNRAFGPVVCGSTQIVMQEYLSVPPAGITISLGQSYGVIYIRNVSSVVIIAAITIPGPITQNWSIPAGGFLLYAAPSPANPSLGQPLTSVNFSPQAASTVNVPVEFLFAQLT